MLISDVKDRPLTHINKKGRPVSQCPHCRGLRRSRTSHVKCDCGDKPHIKENCRDSEKVEPSAIDFDRTRTDSLSSEPGAANVRVCCCGHGSRCVCASKKDSLLDPVPEQDFNEISPNPSFSYRKPRLLTAHSEKTLTVFTKGHHKPVHKLNDAAHKRGIPYPIPIPHSVPGNSHHSKDIARRSADSLPTLRTIEQAPLQFQESISSAQQDVRLVRSEHGSPQRPLPAFRRFANATPPLDVSYLGYHGMPSPLPDEYGHYHSAGAFESYYSPQDETPPTLSAGLASPVIDWSALDFPPENRPFPSAYSQPPPYTAFDQQNITHSGLTTSSSGELSEVGDYISHYRVQQEAIPPSSPEIPAANAYRLNSTSSYVNIPHGSISPDGDRTRNQIDSYLQNPTASPTELEEAHSGESVGSNSFGRHVLTVQDAQKLARSEVLNETVRAPALPTPLDELDPLWAAPFQANDVQYDQRGNPSSAWPTR